MEADDLKRPDLPGLGLLFGLEAEETWETVVGFAPNAFDEKEDGWVRVSSFTIEPPKAFILSSSCCPA